MPELTREDLIAAAKQAASQTGGVLSRTEFIRISGITDHHISRLFPDGRWSELRELAGLPRHPKDNEPITNEELFLEIHRVISELGRIPTLAVLNSRMTAGAALLKKKFGALQGALQKYRAWLEQNHPGSPLIEMVHVKSRHEIVTSSPQTIVSSHAAQWTKGTGVVYGAPINFRGLRHAPINEQGVVYLFGMVSSELGLIVEAIQSAYPDCEAKRCVDRNENRWQRVRIEFEFRSRNFRDHGHDPAGCDLVVCWEHDWPECPLEVVELRSVIDQLEG